MTSKEEFWKKFVLYHPEINSRIFFSNYFGQPDDVWAWIEQQIKQAKADELARVLRLANRDNTVFLTIPKVDITDRLRKLNEPEGVKK